MISTYLPSATPLSALNFSCFHSVSFTSLITQTELLSAKQQHHVSVEFSPDLVQIQVRETVSGVCLARMDIPIQVWHMVEMMQRNFNEHHMMQIPITENQLGTKQMIEEVTEHLGMNYPEIPHSRFVV